jgi:hypothetical protein
MPDGSATLTIDLSAWWLLSLAMVLNAEEG